MSRASHTCTCTYDELQSAIENALGGLESLCPAAREAFGPPAGAPSGALGTTLRVLSASIGECRQGVLRQTAVRGWRATCWTACRDNGSDPCGSAALALAKRLRPARSRPRSQPLMADT
jgi:hypothetical protein